MFSNPIKTLRKKTAIRLTFWYSAIFIGSSLLLFSLAYFLVSSAITENNRKSIAAKLDEYVLMAQSGGLDALAGEIRLEAANNRLAGIFVRLTGGQGIIREETLPSGWSRNDIDADRLNRILSDGTWAVVKKKDDENVLDITGRRLPDGAFLEVGADSGQREKLLERFREIFIGIMIPVVLLGFMAGAFLAMRTLKPVRNLIRTVGNITQGRMDARVPRDRSGSELDELARLFNGMLEKIESLIGGMRASLDNVAHDLKTPVARLRSVVESSLQTEHADEQRLREALMDCGEESERIITMLDTLMDISEAETGVMKLTIEPVNLADIIRDVIGLYEYVAEEKSVKLTGPAEGLIMAAVDANRIRQVLANLLDNAIKYTPAGGRVSLEAGLESGRALLRVTDNGTGIPEEDLPRIFDRLFRGDRSRSQRGIGLGLSLVRAIVRAHGGDIRVVSRQGHGSAFSVYLPVKKG